MNRILFITCGLITLMVTTPVLAHHQRVSNIEPSSVNLVTKQSRAQVSLPQKGQGKLLFARANVRQEGLRVGRQANRRIDRQANRRENRQVGRRADRRANRQIGRQENRRETRAIESRSGRRLDHKSREGHGGHR